jgi:radical SAM superfamily enzyme YgiQ (UPF0313 family)
MRVLLAHPPLNVLREVSPPLGLSTLAAWLKHHGHEVRCLDLDLEIKDLAEGQDMYLDLLANEVHEFSPHAVGITSMYNNSLQAERMIRVVKECDDSVVTIGGGSHFGALGQQALRRIPELDFAIEGEGEEAFSLLLSALQADGSVAGIPRLHYRADGKLCATPTNGLMDLSVLPPIWSYLDGIIDLRRYAATVPEGSARRAIYIEAGRGCPFRCTFCATAPFWERKYRVKPIERIIDEMRFLYEEYNYNAFMLVHDLLTANRKFIDRFSEAMIDARLPVEWMANHRTDIDLHGLLPKMKTAGCWAMFFGVESASERLQQTMEKGLERDGVVSTITGLSDLGIASTCSFVIGFPDETPEELSKTVAMGAELKVLGAGLVQYHRLRTWPPAPLSRAELPAEFDLDSLHIEYPFIDVPSEDVAAIEADREFFAGYFAPYSQSGTFAELAQVELFFTQVIAVSPLTIAVMGRLITNGFMESFYDVLSRRGAITRERIDAAGEDALSIWQLLRPYLEDWMAEHSDLPSWQHELMQAVMKYEEKRLVFVNSEREAEGEMLTRGDNWGAFLSDVDIATVFEAIHANQPLTPELVDECAVVFTREGIGSYHAYTTEIARLAELPSHLAA